MKRGEVWRVRLPAVSGHTQAGMRPAVIVQDEQVTASLPTVLVIPCAGTLAAARFPGTLLVQPDGQNGLTVPSAALVFQLTAVDKRNFLQQLGTLDPATPDRLFAELDTLNGRRLAKTGLASGCAPVRQLKRRRPRRR